MFSLPAINDVLDDIATADLFYFSHISLAILSPKGRAALINVAEQVRARGGVVAYDSNYRPRLWEEEAAARFWSNQATALASIGLPTLEDEQAMHSIADSAEAVAKRWHALGCREVIVKRGAKGPLVAIQDTAPLEYSCNAVSMVDSSGAGDAFNAAYLTARLQGHDAIVAAHDGHELAAWVVARPGALPPLDIDAPYRTAARDGGEVADSKVSCQTHIPI
jgi:2-dehydro-3-deoxygluconokinase